MSRLSESDGGGAAGDDSNQAKVPDRPRAGRGQRPWLVPVVVAVIIISALWRWPRPGDVPGELVVYCAHDSIYSEQILGAFERSTGIRVVVRFDTEATKSLGLINLIRAERANPRCDVFWNNQVLGTIELVRDGLVEPYKGSGWERVSERYRDPDGYWAGFAGRLRVFVVNTDIMTADDDSIRERLHGDLSRVAIANPLYGTTLSHYSVLYDRWGADRLRDWHHDLQQRGVRQVTGNSTVKNLVAEGVCDFGWTDTDDVFVALDAHRPVAMVPVRLADGSTICIPNSVAIIRGTKKPNHARRLVDFLLSEQTELALAHSRSRQIPLSPVDEDQVPEEVRQLREWARDGCDLISAADARVACLNWLNSEHLE